MAVTDGADVIAASGGVTTSGSIAYTDGADTISASGTVGSAPATGSVAVTDGADTMSASGGVTTSGTVATTDGADTMSASGGITTSGTVAVTDGADVASSSGGVTTSGTVAATDGADSISASGTLGGSSITGSVDATDTADAMQADGLVRSGGGYDDEKKAKRRYVIERDGRLVSYGTVDAAIRALDAAVPKEAEPAQEVVELRTVQAYAEVAGRIDDYNAAWNSRHFEQLMALFDQVRAQLEEEDLEMLLLAV